MQKAQKRIAITIIAIVLSLGILGSVLFMAYYVHNQTILRDLTAASTPSHSVINAAEVAISANSKVNTKDIKVVSVRTIKSRDWFILYKIKNSKGFWVPLEVDANYGVEVTETVSGQFHSYFHRY